LEVDDLTVCPSAFTNEWWYLINSRLLDRKSFRATVVIVLIVGITL